MKIGSEAHKELFCQNSVETYQNYAPYKLSWPQLDDAALTLLQRIPCWRESLGLEVKAGVMKDLGHEECLGSLNDAYPGDCYPTGYSASAAQFPSDWTSGYGLEPFSLKLEFRRDLDH